LGPMKRVRVPSSPPKLTKKCPQNALSRGQRQSLTDTLTNTGGHQMSNKDTKLKELARKAAAAAIVEAVKSAAANGMRRDDMCDICPHVTNAAARLASGAGIALPHELADDEELAEPASDGGGRPH
jgi:hypothetical protein